jgi:hypothetical protein
MTDKNFSRADKKIGKNDFMCKLVSGISLDEIEQYKKENSGMEFSLDQFYTAKLEAIINQKFLNHETLTSVKLWIGDRMSVRKIDNLFEIHLTANPEIKPLAK